MRPTQMEVKEERTIDGGLSTHITTWEHRMGASDQNCAYHCIAIGGWGKTRRCQKGKLLAHIGAVLPLVAAPSRWPAETGRIFWL